jgi:NADH:ubiquinone oxidoreductase subunit 2 (subunit N)
MRKRGSRRGFSMFFICGFIPLTVGFWAWMFLIDPYFHEPFFLLVALGNVGISVAGIFEYLKQPPYQPHAAA